MAKISVLGIEIGSAHACSPWALDTYENLVRCSPCLDWLEQKLQTSCEEIASEEQLWRLQQEILVGGVYAI